MAPGCLRDMVRNRQVLRRFVLEEKIDPDKVPAVSRELDRRSISYFRNGAMLVGLFLIHLIPGGKAFADTLPEPEAG